MIIEDLDMALVHPNISITPFASPGDHFERRRGITINGDYYEIEWWINICYLHCGVLIIPFHFVKQCNSWPNRSKVNLQFYDSTMEVCCVLPIEKYEEIKP